MRTVETQYITDLGKYLKETKADEIIVRTTYVAGGWHDAEFTAHYYGFDIYRFQNPDYIARHEFSGCYKLIRRTK